MFDLIYKLFNDKPELLVIQQAYEKFKLAQQAKENLQAKVFGLDSTKDLHKEVLRTNNTIAGVVSNITFEKAL